MTRGSSAWAARGARGQKREPLRGEDDHTNDSLAVPLLPQAAKHPQLAK